MGSVLLLYCCADRVFRRAEYGYGGGTATVTRAWRSNTGGAGGARWGAPPETGGDVRVCHRRRRVQWRRPGRRVVGVVHGLMRTRLFVVSRCSAVVFSWTPPSPLGPVDRTQHDRLTRAARTLATIQNNFRNKNQRHCTYK